MFLVEGDVVVGEIVYIQPAKLMLRITNRRIFFFTAIQLQ